MNFTSANICYIPCCHISSEDASYVPSVPSSMFGMDAGNSEVATALDFDDLNARFQMVKHSMATGVDVMW